jgi:hypothetical protein
MNQFGSGLPNSRPIASAHPGGRSRAVSPDSVSFVFRNLFTMKGSRTISTYGRGCVPVHEVDDSFEQVELVLGLADATADDHLPRPAVQRLSHDCLDVVTPLSANRQISTPIPALAKRAIPTAMASAMGAGSHGPPVRVEPDHQDPRLGSACIHPSTVAARWPALSRARRFGQSRPDRYSPTYQPCRCGSREW